MRAIPAAPEPQNARDVFAGIDTAQPLREPERERERPIIIREGFVQKIFWGVLCSGIVAVIMNFVGLKWLFVHVIALFLSLFGRDSYVVKPTDAVQATATDTLDVLKDKAQKAAHPVAVAPSLPIPGLAPKTPEQLKIEQEQKEAERLRREKSERETLLARAAVVKFEIDKDWTLERLRVEVPHAEERVEEAEKKKPLLQRADKIGLEVDLSWDSKALRKQVEDAEEDVAKDAAYQAERREWERAMEQYKYQLAHGPNARCPRCKKPLRVSPGAAKRTLQCKACLTSFGGSRAMALWKPPPPPKEPTPPGRKSSFLRRLFK